MSARLRAIPNIERATHAVALRVARIPKAGVDQAEAHVLSHLYATDGERIGDIHAAFGHRRSTLTSVLDRLERRGLVRRKADPDDRRSLRVSLTAAGRALARRIHRALSEAEADVLARFSPRDIAAFLAVLAAFGDLGRSV